MSQNAISNRLFSIPQIARGGEFEAIPMHRITLYKLAESGELKSIKVGRRRLVSTAAIEDFIASRQ